MAKYSDKNTDDIRFLLVNVSSMYTNSKFEPTSTDRNENVIFYIKLVNKLLTLITCSSVELALYLFSCILQQTRFTKAGNIC